MNKYLKAFFVTAVGFSFLNVSAMQHKTVEIFPANEVASVNTETFDYTNFSYKAAGTGEKFGKIEFESIKNNTEKTLPVSINILMFDANKKNIGFLTYCSTKDISSDYSQMKIKPSASSEYSITVSDTYFAGGYSGKDIQYLAILDDNKYCQIGGYDKYKGLTIEEISNRNSYNVGESVKPNMPKVNIGKFIRTVILIVILIVGGKFVFRRFINRRNKGFIPPANDENTSNSILNTNSFSGGDTNNDSNANNNNLSDSIINSINNMSDNTNSVDNSDSGRTTFFNDGFSEDNIIDLNYNTASPDNNDGFGSSNSNNTYGTVKGSNGTNGSSNNGGTGSVKNSKDGESDLANFFK